MRVKGFSSLCWLVIGLSLSTATHALPEAPYGHSFFSAGLYSGRMEAFTLGPVCTVIPQPGIPWPCQPADLAKNEQRQLYVDFLIGDEVGTVEENRRLMRDDNNLDLVRNLFSEHDPVRMEAALSLSLLWEQSAVVFVPFRYSYASAVQNRYYPELSLYALEERSLWFQHGVAVNDQLHLGFQVRGAQYKWLISDVFLFDTLVDNAESLRVKEQSALFFEPGAAYTWDHHWRPRLTAFLSGFGYVEEPQMETPKDLTLDLGMAISPPLDAGRWDLGVVYELSDPSDDVEEAFSLGSSFVRSNFKFLSSLGHHRWKVAFMPTFGNLGLGLLYQKQKVKHPGHSDIWDEAFFFTLRADF